jgi:hypothetical protein
MSLDTAAAVVFGAPPSAPQQKQQQQQQDVSSLLLKAAATCLIEEGMHDYNKGRAFLWYTNLVGTLCVLVIFLPSTGLLLYTPHFFWGCLAHVLTALAMGIAARKTKADILCYHYNIRVLDGTAEARAKGLLEGRTAAMTQAIKDAIMADLFSCPETITIPYVTRADVQRAQGLLEANPEFAVLGDDDKAKAIALRAVYDHIKDVY